MRKREIVSFSIVKLNAFTSLKIFETRSKIALKPTEIQAKNRENIRSERRQKNWRAITRSISSSTICFQFLSIEENFTKEVYPPSIKQGGGEKRIIVLPHFLQTYEIHFRIEIIIRIKEKKLYIGIKFKFLSSSGPRFANILLSLFVVYIESCNKRFSLV